LLKHQFLIAVIVTGFLVIFLYSYLTWFILSEINILFIIFSIPLIREFDIKKPAQYEDALAFWAQYWKIEVNNI